MILIQHQTHDQWILDRGTDQIALDIRINYMNEM